jgi:hypothetical protein
MPLNKQELIAKAAESLQSEIENVKLSHVQALLRDQQKLQDHLKAIATFTDKIASSDNIVEVGRLYNDYMKSYIYKDSRY